MSRGCTQLLVVVLAGGAFGRVYERCELVRELSQPRYRIPAEDLPVWVCIAQHESQYNTSAVGHLNADGSGDHGLFQISDQYWCSPPGVGLACGLNCDQLEDEDIKDDVICARRIFRATKRRTGNGFTAWAVYGSHCRGNVSSYVEGCEDEDEVDEEITTDTLQSKASFEGPRKSAIRPLTLSDNSHPGKLKIHHTTAYELTTKPIINLVATRRSFSSDNKHLVNFRNIPEEQRSNRIHLTPEQKSSSIPTNVEDSSSTSTSKLLSTSRSPGTSFGGRRPTTNPTDQDSTAAWLRIHNDPRFLNQFP